MTTRVAINGFGRIGRLVLRAAFESRRKDIEFVAINDLGSIDANALLLQRDTIHGPFPGKVRTTKTGINIGKRNIKINNNIYPVSLEKGFEIRVDTTFSDSEELYVTYADTVYSVGLFNPDSGEIDTLFVNVRD